MDLKSRQDVADYSGYGRRLVRISFRSASAAKSLFGNYRLSTEFFGANCVAKVEKLTLICCSDVSITRGVFLRIGYGTNQRAARNPKPPPRLGAVRAAPKRDRRPEKLSSRMAPDAEIAPSANWLAGEDAILLGVMRATQSTVVSWAEVALALPGRSPEQ